MFIPVSLRAQVDVLLYSPVECKVPYGRRSEYLIGLIREDLERRKKDA